MIKTDYLNLEKKILPIMQFLESHKNEDKYKNLYKGFITLHSPLVKNPDILFIGINPGEGASIENKSKGINETIRVFNPESEIDLDWFKFGVARAEMQGNVWKKGYHWYQRDKKIHNTFPQRMIDLLYEIGKLKYPNKYETQKYDNETLPFWNEDLGKSIMYTNLYPIATTNTEDLKKIFSLLIKEPEIKQLLNKGRQLKKWDLQLYLIKIIKDMVDLVKPKVIVCMGVESFDDFTYTHNKKADKIFSLPGSTPPVIGFLRRGNWSGVIPKLAKVIANEL